ncbi:MAG: hypothetical protein WBZ36_08505 [Candidatus Nitrosopolaris sp.]
MTTTACVTTQAYEKERRDKADFIIIHLMLTSAMFKLRTIHIAAKT